MMRKKTFTLNHWVLENGGVRETAERLNVGEHTVRVWVRGNGTPRVKTIVEMIKLSRGRLTFERISRDATRSLKGKERLSC